MLRPLQDHLLVRPDPARRKVGLVHLPDTKSTRVHTGVVERVGKGKRFKDGVYRPTQVQVGERVAYLTAVPDAGSFAAAARVLGEDHVIIGESDVLFVIEGDPPEME